MKANRHYKTKVIISTQHVNDLRPECYKQLDILILMRGHSLDKLEEIHSKTAMNISLDRFIKIYKHATEGKHDFLWIDLPNLKFRKCFTDAYNDEEEDEDEG